jgi:hypothetical protein
VIAKNGFAHIITVIQSKVEDIKSLPDPSCPEVDIVISEWYVCRLSLRLIGLIAAWGVGWATF